ncbi:MAG: hypothetical protein Q9219_002570 [cf. Caloplaca sp. 3 TL-2023]
MPQAFTFGFDDEDVEGNDLDNEDTCPVHVESGSHEENAGMSTLQLQDVDEILAALPSSIQYNTISLCSNYNDKIILARRELFDIRAQLMAEDTSLGEASTGGLSADDIKPNIYEGGFKTWECSVDLARYLLQHATDLYKFLLDTGTIIELGAGTALPSLLLFHLLLSTPPTQQPPQRTLVLTDYNPSVLSLATIPNLLLTYALTCNLVTPESGDLNINSTLLTSFKQTLSDRNIQIRAVAGNWGSTFASAIISPNEFHSSSIFQGNALMLASETIYSPTSTLAFTTTLLQLLRECESREKMKVLVAAKRVYFGVGGGVNEFMSVLQENGAIGNEVWTTEGGGSGVGRCILEVTQRES